MKRYRVDVLKQDGSVAFVCWVKAETNGTAKALVRKGIMLRAEETTRWPIDAGRKQLIQT